jgi:hypothetical protein
LVETNVDPYEDSSAHARDITFTEPVPCRLSRRGGIEVR